MSAFRLRVATSAGNAFEGEVESVSMRGADGDFMILADHAPFMTLVKPSECAIVTAEGSRLRGECDGGIFQTADNEATLLTGKIELKEE